MYVEHTKYSATNYVSFQNSSLHFDQIALNILTVSLVSSSTITASNFRFLSVLNPSVVDTFCGDTQLRASPLGLRAVLPSADLDKSCLM